MSATHFSRIQFCLYSSEKRIITVHETFNQMMITGQQAVVKFSRNGVPQPVSGVPPPEIAVPPPNVVAPQPGDAVLYFWSVFFRENHYNNIVASRSQILRLKISAGAPPQTPLGELTALAQTLAGFKGLLLREGEGKEGKGMGGNVEFHHLLLSNLTTDSKATSYSNSWPNLETNKSYILHLLNRILFYNT